MNTLENTKAVQEAAERGYKALTGTAFMASSLNELT